MEKHVYRYSQLIVIQFNGTDPFVYRIVSNSKITQKKVVSYFKKTEGFQDSSILNKDILYFLDEPLRIPV